MEIFLGEVFTAKPCRWRQYIRIYADDCLSLTPRQRRGHTGAPSWGAGVFGAVKGTRSTPQQRRQKTFKTSFDMGQKVHHNINPIKLLLHQG